MNPVFTKENVAKTAWRLMLITVGSAITGFGISSLLEPAHLLCGGVTGISMLLSYFVPVQAGIFVMIFNIPLMVIAWRKIDLTFCLYSIIGTAMMSLFMVLFHELNIQIPMHEPLLAALFGGMLSGGGTGIVIRAHGSHGGTDIVSVIVRKKFSISIGMVGLYINIAIVGVLALKFGLELALLTIFSQYMAAVALDRIVMGIDTAKSIMIVSDKADEIAKYIMEKMSRGVTFLEGKGGFQGTDKKVIWCVVSTTQISRVKSAMKRIDPKAFMSIVESSEIVGKGFHRAPF